MLPKAKKLERLLQSLFEDNDESTPDGVAILRKPRLPLPSSNCCTHSYANYGG